MRTILYQGRPSSNDAWTVLPEGFAETYQSLGYQTRELVLRSEAEEAQIEYFNAAVAQAATVAVERGADAAAEKIRKLRMRNPAKSKVVS